MAGDGDEHDLPSYGALVGQRLRLVRQQRRLTLQEVEHVSNGEFKASVLGAYERGERIISVLRLQRLARFYGVPVDQLLPRDIGPMPTLPRPAGSDANGTAGTDIERDGSGPVAIDLARLETIEAPEKDLISRYVGMIQLQRGDFNGRVLTIRDEDIRALARLFELDAESMRQRFEELGLRLQPADTV